MPPPPFHPSPLVHPWTPQKTGSLKLPVPPPSLALVFHPPASAVAVDPSPSPFSPFSHSSPTWASDWAWVLTRAEHYHPPQARHSLSSMGQHLSRQEPLHPSSTLSHDFLALQKYLSSPPFRLEALGLWSAFPVASFRTLQIFPQAGRHKKFLFWMMEADRCHLRWTPGRKKSHPGAFHELAATLHDSFFAETEAESDLSLCHGHCLCSLSIDRLQDPPPLFHHLVLLHHHSPPLEEQTPVPWLLIRFPPPRHC